MDRLSPSLGTSIHEDAVVRGNNQVASRDVGIHNVAIHNVGIHNVAIHDVVGTAR